VATLARIGFCAKGHRLMSKNPRRATTAATAGNVPAQVTVRLRRLSCNEAESYPPDGQAREWWQRLKNALGTASSAFVDASLQQLIAAARLPNGGISEIAVNATLAFVEGAKPQSEVESALVMQMSCTHAAAMAVLGRTTGAHGPTRSIAATFPARCRKATPRGSFSTNALLERRRINSVLNGHDRPRVHTPLSPQAPANEPTAGACPF